MSDPREVLTALRSAKTNKRPGDIVVKGVVVATARDTDAGFFVELTSATRKLLDDAGLMPWGSYR